MKYACLLLMLMSNMWAFGQATDGERLEVLKTLTGRFGRRDIYEIIYALPPGDKQLLINYYRSEVLRLSGLNKTSTERMTRDIHLPTAHDALAKLGDPEELNSLLDVVKWRSIYDPEYQPAFEKLVTAGRPEVLVELAPLMFVDDANTVDPKYGVGGDLSPPRAKSVSSTGSMIGIIRKSPAFSPETRAWAKNHPVDERGRAAVRRWWKENEEYFKAGNYKAVKPGEDIHTRDVIEYWPKHQEAEAEYWRTHPEAVAEAKKRQAAEQSGNATPSPVAVVPIHSAEPHNSAFGYALTAGVLLVLASGLWAFRSSAAKRP